MLKQSLFPAKMQKEEADKNLSYRNKFLSKLLLLQGYQILKREVWKTCNLPEWRVKVLENLRVVIAVFKGRVQRTLVPKSGNTPIIHMFPAGLLHMCPYL